VRIANPAGDLGDLVATLGQLGPDRQPDLPGQEPRLDGIGRLFQRAAFGLEGFTTRLGLQGRYPATEVEPQQGE